jgi:hypothetical protein
MHKTVSSVNYSISSISEDHVIEPYFFDKSVSHAAYLNMHQTWFVPQLRERDLEATAVLQQDGAQAHCAFPVREYLDN